MSSTEAFFDMIAVMRSDRTRRGQRIANVLLLFACAAFPGVAPQEAHAQAPDFDAVSSRLGDAILSLSRGLIVKPTVVVMDFVETHGASNAMGAELSRRFSSSLAKNARDFVVADSNYEFDTSSASRLPPSSAGDSAVNCSAGQPKPTFVVEGFMDELQDRVVIRIKATRTEDNKAVLDERVTVPLTPELQALESKPPLGAEKPSGESGPTWVRPGFHVPDNGARVPSVDSGGHYTPPRCLECPRAQYPDSAMAAKVQGVISLRILVDATGQPAEIIVLKGLPCGLNERAIETVATWRLEPAKGPDGKPLAVWQHVQLSFELSN
jgi:TonB family protein